jgi:elongation factor P--(R)-beta-lysine ligase
MDLRLRQRLMRHARFTDAIRSFFNGRGYAEVDTPSLSPHLIPEPAIEVFQTEYLPANGAVRPMWLIPSPESWMKRLLARGAGDIYQISRSFRNCDFGGPHHNPEFRLLEWYTGGAGYLDSIRVIEDLFAHLLEHTAPGRPAAELAPPFHRLTMEEAFLKFAGIDLAQCQEIPAIIAEGMAKGIAMPESPTWEEAFHIVFLTLVEPALPRDKPLVLLDYPALVPTTARRLQGTPWSQRWELYVDGVEIANCYTEETEAAALGPLLAHEEERRMGCRTSHAADRDFAGLFPPGFPACSGAAVGVDRLEMVFQGEKSLEGVILFPFSAIVGGQSGTRA